jgi:hypothetical protein
MFSRFGLIFSEIDLIPVFFPIEAAARIFRFRQPRSREIAGTGKIPSAGASPAKIFRFHARHRGKCFDGPAEPRSFSLPRRGRARFPRRARHPRRFSASNSGHRGILLEVESRLLVGAAGLGLLTFSLGRAVFISGSGVSLAEVVFPTLGRSGIPLVHNLAKVALFH